jgi:hypothetical protein
MSKFKYIAKVKQHTRIIHFQGNESGATLRATELKPKFDKFLKKYAFNNENEYKKFLIKDKEAFDYKVTVEENKNKAENIDDRDPLYFGNMGLNKKKKFKYKDVFIITFFSFKKELIKIIEEHFESFLANTNFASRQSKGFGAFYLVDKEFNPSLIKYPCYYFESNIKNYKNDIKLFYQFLRQGINLKNATDTTFYSKPAIFTYFKSRGISWEKKAIKEVYINNNHQIEPSNLIRDLFGLSSNESWRSYHATIKKENENIHRFQSPITFKPIINEDKVKVYFWADNSVENILNKEFNIKFDNRNDLSLFTPESFNFEEFFKYTFKIDLKKHINQEYHNKPQFKTLNNILSTLKGQL